MSVQFNGEAALGIIRDKTLVMVAEASEFVAVHAQERAPLGKGTNRGKGIHATHSIRLRPLRQFRKGESKTRQQELLGLTNPEVGRLYNGETLRFPHGPDIKPLTAKDRNRFVLTSGPNKGESPDLIEPGKRGVLKGAKVYSPGRLRRGIHTTPVRVDGNVVRGRVVSSAPYSMFVEKGFHHKGGTVVQGRHFMKKAVEEDTREGFVRGDFYPR